MERPILFNAEMVKAILDGRKTQTRRIVKPQPELGKPWKHGWIVDPEIMDIPVAFCPYGQRSDSLWVRETFFYEWPHDYPPDDMRDCRIVYRATEPDYIDGEMREANPAYRWSPSIHMPRWASRLTLENTGVRVEQVQDISRNDVIAEGIGQYTFAMGVLADDPPDPRWKFIELWDSINAKRGFGWDVNLWVWVIKFEPR